MLPEWVWNLSAQQCRKLIYSMQLGDDSVYYTSSIELADQFMRLCLHAGWSGNQDAQHDLWKITVLTKDHEQNKQIEEVYDYTGHVYCLQVPNEVFMVRRNGKAVWTGNSRGSNGPVVNNFATVSIAKYLLVYGMVGNTVKLRGQPVKFMVPRAA
jgi:hypothetical protein